MSPAPAPDTTLVRIARLCSVSPAASFTETVKTCSPPVVPCLTATDTKTVCVEPGLTVTRLPGLTPKSAQFAGSTTSMNALVVVPEFVIVTGYDAAAPPAATFWGSVLNAIVVLPDPRAWPGSETASHAPL